MLTGFTFQQKIKRWHLCPHSA